MNPQNPDSNDASNSLNETLADQTTAHQQPADSQNNNLSGGNPLSLAAEWGRQWRRRRTQWVFGIVLALPLIVVAAFALSSGNNSESGSNDPGSMMAQLATGSAANFTTFNLVVCSALLLSIVAALFVGDALPSEASWSSLRYLLTAPVSRSRLLTSKLVVGIAYVALVTVVLVVWSLLIGLIFYGTAPFRTVFGGELAWPVFSTRMAWAVGYVFVQLLPVGAIAFWIGTKSDAPLAAVGGALLVVIIFGILDAIEALGTWRHGLLGHYQMSWLELFRADVSWVEMQRGVAWAVLYTLVFVFLGYRNFSRKNILS